MLHLAVQRLASYRKHGPVSAFRICVFEHFDTAGDPSGTGVDLVVELRIAVL